MTAWVATERGSFVYVLPSLKAVITTGSAWKQTLYKERASNPWQHRCVV